MKQPSKQSKKMRIGQFAVSRRLFIPLTIGVIVAVGAFAIYWLAPAFTNYAYEAAKPIEAALINAGAMKKCSSEDSGKGWGNLRPNYGAKYLLKADRQTATALIAKVAKDNGFSLTPRDSEYSYIDHFSDTSSVRSAYKGYENGNVEISMSVYSGGDKLGCTGDASNFDLDGSHVGITLNVILPKGQ